MQIQRGIFLLLGLMLTGCATKAIPDAIYQDQENIVRLEARPQDPSLTSEDDFQHPLELAEEELKTILQSIRVQESRGLFSLFKRTQPASLQAFSKEEAQRMAGPLSSALARAKPNERVTFLFTHPRGRFSKDVTSGVLFIKADRLHLILGRYRAASRPHEKDIALTDPALPAPPYLGFRLAAGPDQALVEAEESPIWKEPAGARHWVMIDFRQLLAHPPQPDSFPVVSEPPGAQDQPEGVQQPTAEIKEKLRLLKELRDENLISEEEHEQKRRELLKEF